jgi:hypothetical protein
MARGRARSAPPMGSVALMRAHARILRRICIATSCSPRRLVAIIIRDWLASDVGQRILERIDQPP